MNIVVERSLIKKTILYIAYSVYLILGIIESSFYAIYVQNYSKIILFSCIILLFLGESITFCVNYKDMMLGIVLIACFVYLYLFIGLGVSLIPLFMYSTRNIGITGIIKISYIISIILLIIIMISSYLGVIENYIYYDTTRERQYLGFRYALYPSSILCNIIFLKVYLDKERISWKSIILLLISSYILYTLTDSRLTFVLGGLILIFSAVNKIIPSICEKILSRLLIFSYAFIGIISLYFTLNYNHLIDWQENLNEILGGRLSLGYSTLEFYGYGLFGREVELVGNGLDVNGIVNSSSYNYVDNLYVQLLLKTGVLFLVFFIICMTYVTYLTYKQKNLYFYVILVMLALHGLIDDLILQIQYNSFWLLITPVIYGILVNRRKTCTII